MKQTFGKACLWCLSVCVLVVVFCLLVVVVVLVCLSVVVVVVVVCVCGGGGVFVYLIFVDFCCWSVERAQLGAFFVKFQLPVT